MTHSLAYNVCSEACLPFFAAANFALRLASATAAGGLRKRTLENATMFMRDLARRVDNRVQISTDGLPAYIRAVEDAFGSTADYGQVVKFYDAESWRGLFEQLRA